MCIHFPPWWGSAFRNFGGKNLILVEKWKEPYNIYKGMLRALQELSFLQIHSVRVVL